MSDLLGLLFQRADATQTFWNFYAGAVTAVLAFVTAGKAQWLNRWVCTGLTAAFIAFAAGNFEALNSLRKQRQELMVVAAAMKDYPKFEKVIGAAKPPSRPGLWLFHGILDLGVLAAIWGVPYARRRHEMRGRR